MKLRHVVQLLRDYPEMFPESFPIDIGDGWYCTVDALMRDLKAIGKQVGVLPTARRIGRLEGSLNIYVEAIGARNAAVCAMHARANFAERLAEITCEQCGLDAVMRVRAQRVRCDECEWFSRYRDEMETEHFAAVRMISVDYIRASLLHGVLVTPELMFMRRLSNMPPDETRVILEAVDNILGYLFSDGWAEGIAPSGMQKFRELEFVDAV